MALVGGSPQGILATNSLGTLTNTTPSPTLDDDVARDESLSLEHQAPRHHHVARPLRMALDHRLDSPDLEVVRTDDAVPLVGRASAGVDGSEELATSSTAFSIMG